MGRFAALSLGVVALISALTAVIVLGERRSFPPSASIVFALGHGSYDLYSIKPNSSFGEPMHTLFMPERTFDDSYVTGVDCAPDSRSLIFWYIFLYRYDLQDEHLTRLILGQGLSQLSVWSPDGTRIAYIDDLVTAQPREIFTIQADGTQKTRITDNHYQETSLTWSPDASQIAFTYYRLDDPARQGLAVVDAAGGTSTVLSESARPINNVSWSPDGKHLAFDMADRGMTDIYTLDRTGGSLTRLTWGGGQNVLPRWSPDGTLISYSSRGDNGHYALYVMNADGSRPYLVFYDPNQEEVLNRCWLTT
jgi:tricorn protease-like protein